MIVPTRTRRHEQSIQGDGYSVLIIAVPRGRRSLPAPWRGDPVNPPAMRRGREYEFAAAEIFVTRGDGQLL
jgi:hypothetical protein